MAKIYIVDDDLAMETLCDGLRFRGHEVCRIASATEALKNLNSIINSNLLILDIIMSWPADWTSNGLNGNATAGMEVLRAVRQQNKNLPVLAYSATQDRTIIEAIEDDPHATFTSKWESPRLRELIAYISRLLGIADEPMAPQPFIVHGTDDATKLSVKNYLQNTLKLPEPIILHEQPNLGRTMIEKFEDCASMSDVIFVLLTPDDVGANVAASDDLKRRARQNVIFEMGYFLGILGRKSGRVILLYKPPLEIPSDISGVVYIDISQGIEAVSEKI